MAEAGISQGTLGRICRVAIRGTARFGLGARFEAFIRDLFTGHAIDAIEFDLTEAEHLDSTMLGLIARAARYSAARSGQRPRIYSTREDITFLLQTNGFDICADTRSEAPPAFGPMAELPPVPETPRDRVARVLDAHRTLMRLNPRNASVFRDAVDALEHDLARHSPPPPTQEAP
jgi:anti-anti-sigma regulatory factor